MLELTTSGMILCHNLLISDANFWDGTHKALADDRRALAAKFREEVERRDTVTAAAFNTESA